MKAQWKAKVHSCLQLHATMRALIAIMCIFGVPSSAASCHNATSYITKERAHSELVMERCDTFESVCASEAQFICFGQWREYARESSEWKLALTNGSGVHYQWVQGESVQVGSHVYEHRYQYVCGPNASAAECTDSQNTNWQTTVQLTLHIVEFRLQRVNDSEQLNEGEDVELECSTGLPDSNEILTRFEFKNQVSYCRPFQEEMETRNGWYVYREARSKNCILKITGLSANDSGEYLCSGFIPYDFFEVKSSAASVFVRAQDEPDTSSGSNSPVVIGLSVGLAATVLVVLLLVVCFAVTQRKKKHPFSATNPLVHDTATTGTVLESAEESLVERSRSVSSADDGKGMILESERVTASQEGNPRSTNV